MIPESGDSGKPLHASAVLDKGVFLRKQCRVERQGEGEAGKACCNLRRGIVDGTGLILRVWGEAQECLFSQGARPRPASIRWQSLGGI
jgi:hypothetical protein